VTAVDTVGRVAPSLKKFPLAWSQHSLHTLFLCCCQAGMNETIVDDSATTSASPAAPFLFDVGCCPSLAFVFECIAITSLCLGILSFTVTTLKQKTGRVASTPHASVLNQFARLFVQLSNNDSCSHCGTQAKFDNRAGWARHI